MKVLIEIAKIIIDKNVPTLLGRWKINYCPELIKRKVDRANEDHCGTCTKPKLKKEKIIDLE